MYQYKNINQGVIKYNKSYVGELLGVSIAGNIHRKEDKILHSYEVCNGVLRD